ncbi:MAG: glutamine--fructose-6-phosphate transaminase (isomerizing) [Candidatus Woesearchaeota archaeon]
MCGIIGYKGKQESCEIILECLKNLEYRGYDSVGMAIKDKNIEIKKDIGNIAEVDKKVKFQLMKGNLGIAHTRWATNGKVTKINSHPHTSNDNEVIIVHNGIIENYQELKKELEKINITCKSETDSEVIAQLISLYLKKNNDIEKAINDTLKKLQGSYAIVGLLKSKNILFFAKNESPLVIGIKENQNKIKEFFIASDVPAFLKYTNKIYYLDDLEYGIIDENIIFKSLKKEGKIIKKYEKIKWDVEQAKKGNFEHYMLKEIYEQIATIPKSILQPKKLIKNVTKTLKNAYGIFFVACGTSYHAAVSASYLFTHIAKMHVNVTLASEFRNYKEYLTDKTIIIAISQSGETADLIDAIKIAKEKNTKIISIVNVMGSTITRMSDYNIMMNAGPEICVLSTKSYTSQIAILLYLAYSITNKQEKAKKTIKSLGIKIQDIININQNKIKKIANKIKKTNSLFLVGRDLAYPSALEGALKIKEVSYIHAEGFAGGELKHGTIALIEKDIPCIVLATTNTRNMILSNASEIKSRGGYIIGIDSEPNTIYDTFLKVPELDTANPISLIIPIQLLAYYLAINKKCNPDKPRNLAKSVTVK